MSPRYTPLVASLPATVPFVGPETAERAMGRPFRARIGANESVFGPSPKAIAAMQAAAGETWKYADPENHDLRHALAAHHGVEPDNIMVGEGIDGLLGYLVRMLVGQGTRVVTSDGAYPTFNFHVAGYGGTLGKVPYRDDAEDPDAVVASMRESGAPLGYFANPDNPMGSWHGAETIMKMIAQVPEDAVLCLDEAYVEFAPDRTAPPLDVSDGRVVRMRTFSKAYGMAGARVGYAIGHAGLISGFNKVRNHFGISRISQIGALAALEDQDRLAHIRAEVAAARERIAAIARANGLIPLPSATNFVTIDCGRDAGYAKAVLDGLGTRGVFVRMPFAAPGNRCIRVSAGKAPDLDIFEAELPKVLAELG